MEVSSYTSNIQPYGSQSGTKIASENERATNAFSPSKNKERVAQSDSVSSNIAERVQRNQKHMLEKSMEQNRQRERISQEQREQLVERMSEFVNSINKGLSFRVDEESGRDVVTIYEASTGDIIRQIPEEEMLEVLRRLAKGQEHKSGLLAIKA